MKTTTVDLLQNLFLIKSKIMHLIWHGDYDNENKTYLAFESMKVFGLMESFLWTESKSYLKIRKTLNE